MPPDPAVGVWQLDIARSSFKRVPALKSRTMTVEPWEDGLKVSVIMIDAQGNQLQPQTSYKFDGKDYPLKGSPIADAICVKRINQRTSEGVWKKHGKVIFTERTVISADGKSLRVTRMHTDARGCEVDDVMVYDRL